MGDDLGLIRGMAVAAQTRITAQGVSIEVVADEAIIQSFSDANLESQIEKLQAKARRFIEIHELLGLDVKSLTRIILTQRLPEGASELFQSSTGVIESLWSRATPMDWGCGESTSCMCCYCFPLPR